MNNVCMKLDMKLILLILPLALTILLSACLPGPRYTRPPSVADTAPSFVHAAALAEAGIDANAEPRLSRWWEQFADPVTVQLVELALENNLDVVQAEARMLEAQALLDSAFGRRLPEVTYGGSATRRVSPIEVPGGGRSHIDTTQHGQTLPVRWQLDLFGRLRRGQRAAYADFLAAEAQRKATLHALIAEVVRVRISIATLWEQLSLTRETIVDRERTLRIVERRYRLGITTPLDYRLARQNLAEARAQEPDLVRQIATTQHALDVLLNRQPGSEPPPGLQRPLDPDLAPIPVGLPVGLLDRRPDLQALARRVEAETERVGVAVATLYPDVTLNGSIGLSALSAGNLFTPESWAGSMAYNAAATLFAGGQLRAAVRAQEARQQIAAAEYAEAVVNALREVEDALITERTSLQRLAELQISFAEIQAAERLARARFSQGLEPLVTLLETQRRRRSTEQGLPLAKGSLWNARVSLFLALGGDWRIA